MKKILLTITIFLIVITALSGCSKSGNFYSVGKKSLKNGDYEKAAESFKTAVDMNTNRADYYIDYGMALTSLGKYDDALAQFNHAYIDKDMSIIKQNNKRALLGKGIAYYHMLQYDKAIEQFQLALNIHVLSDSDMDILYYMADSMQFIGSYEDALKAYNRLIGMDRKSAVVYNKRASCYKCMGDYEKSLADYENAIVLDPKKYDYYFGKYYLMAEHEDDTGAADVLTQAEALPVVTKEDKYNQAKVYFFKGNYEQALSGLSEGYNDGFTEAYYYIGEIYRIQKDYEKATYYYDIYIKNGVMNSSNVFNQIALCKMKTGDYTEALRFLEQGLAYNYAGTYKTLKKNEIIVYENLGRYDKAKDKMDEYLAKYPEDPDAKREADFIATRVITVTDTDKNK